MTKDSNSVMAKAEELGLTAYMLNASDIDVENRAKLKCAYGCRRIWKTSELSAAHHFY